VEESLSQFQRQLERVGVRVVPHRNHLCVRLPLFASVRVHVEEGDLKLHLQTGPTGPGRVLAWTALVTTLLVGILAHTFGVGALTLTVTFGGLALLVLELGQLVLADGCATRLMLQWESRSTAHPRSQSSFVQTTSTR
jgi:hypothetical protein